jgi:hypothetical protein
MYNALILSNLPVLDNKKIWKMKIPLKNKKLHGIFVEELFLLKIILLSAIGMGVRCVCFVCDNKTLVFLMQLCTFYMVSHPGSFRLVSTN